MLRWRETRIRLFPLGPAPEGLWAFCWRVPAMQRITILIWEKLVRLWISLMMCTRLRHTVRSRIWIMRTRLMSGCTRISRPTITAGAGKMENPRTLRRPYLSRWLPAMWTISTAWNWWIQRLENPWLWERMAAAEDSINIWFRKWKMRQLFIWISFLRAHWMCHIRWTIVWAGMAVAQKSPAWMIIWQTITRAWNLSWPLIIWKWMKNPVKIWNLAMRRTSTCILTPICRMYWKN